MISRYEHALARSARAGAAGAAGGIVVLPTVAALRPDLHPADQDPAYLAKYAEHIPRIGSTRSGSPDTTASRSP